LDSLLSAKKNKKTPQCDSAGLATLCYSARNLLDFHRELGVEVYPAVSGMENIFIQKGVTSAPPKNEPATSSGKNNRPSREEIAQQLENIENTIATCSRCSAVPHSVVPGQGSSSSRLFVVGDWYEGGEVQKGLIWGREEDNLFWKMMEAIGLDRQSVYVSNCVKCLQKEKVSLPEEATEQCFSYLEQELLAIQPTVICTMGEVAAWLLLKKKAPLFRLRGRFHRYRYPHGTEAKVMPTYHPRFLLQHQEMKRATWMDLQSVQKVLPVK
jgi:DNA polymerase